MNELLIQDIKEKALANSVPIMEDEGIEFVKNYLKDNNITSLLEVGTAVGYSSIVFASYCENLTITTIEKDEERHNIAKENIKKANLEDRIEALLGDAREADFEKEYDAIFLDGPKAHHKELMKRYTANLKKGGVIIVDDVYFHGLTEHPEQIKTRRLRALIRKINRFREEMLNSQEYQAQYLEIGDGILILQRREDI